MFRSSFVDENSNPWSPSSTYIHVGSLQNILKFAEKSGHIAFDRVSFKFNLSLSTLYLINTILMKIIVIRCE